MAITADLHPLLSASQGELYSLLGANSLAIESPSSLLTLGREGALWQSPPPVLGTETPFEHVGFQNAANAFLRRWRVELQKAVCGNEALYAEEKKRGVHDVDLLIAAIVGSISASVPPLAPFVPLLTVLAVIIVKTGLRSFCETLGEIK